MHKYQAYLHLEKERVMPIIKAAYAKYAENLPEGSTPETLLKFQSNAAKQMLNDESQEVLDRIEEYRQNPPNFLDDNAELSTEAQKAVQMAE